jgi:leucyl aminopeptidase
MKYTAIEKLTATDNVDAVYAVGLFSDATAEEQTQVLNAIPDRLQSLVQGQIQVMLDNTTESTGFSYGVLNSTPIHSENETGKSTLLFVGLGTRASLDYIRLRHCAALVTRWVKEKSYSTLCINLPTTCNNIDKAALAILEGVDLSVFEGLWVRQTHNYKSDKNLADDWESQTLKETQLVNPGCSQAELDTYRSYCRGVHLARELVATPANIATPQELLAHAQSIAEINSLQLNALDERALMKNGMNGICAVSSGATRPLFLHLQYKPATDIALGPLALIGLGLTFDPDGLSQGHSGTIEGMKKNMAGAANVLAAAEIIGQQKPAIQVDFILPLAERDRSLRPGDLITLSNGETIEINGSHIEGHLMLADALLFAQSLGAQRVVSTATLSNAPVASLGTRIAPVWSNSEAATTQLIHAGAMAGEQLWPLPIVDEHRATLVSPFADFRTPREEFGAGLDALFLQQFIGEMDWGHIDISGTSWSALVDGYLNAGATGWGVGTLTNWVDIVAQAEAYINDGNKRND